MQGLYRAGGLLWTKDIPRRRSLNTRLRQSTSHSLTTLGRFSLLSPFIAYVSHSHTQTHTHYSSSSHSVTFNTFSLSQSISQSIIKTSVSQSKHQSISHTDTHTHTLSSPPITPASDFTKTDRTLIPVTRSVSQPHALIISHRKADSRPYYNQISRGESRTNRSKRTIEAHEWRCEKMQKIRMWRPAFRNKVVNVPVAVRDVKDFRRERRKLCPILACV